MNFKFGNFSNPTLICNEEHRFIVAEQMREINVTPKAIILEPEAKNTAPAIALAAFKALEDNENESAIMINSEQEKSIYCFRINEGK